MIRILFIPLILSGVICHGQIKNVSISLSGNHTLSKTVRESSRLTYTVPAQSGFSQVTMNQGSLVHHFTGRSGFDLMMSGDFRLTDRLFVSSGLRTTMQRYNIRTDISVPVLTLSLVGNGGVVQPGSSFGSIYGVIGSNYFRDSEGRIIVREQNSLFTKSEDVGNTVVYQIQVPALVGTSFLKNRVSIKGGPVISAVARANSVKQQMEFGQTTGIMVVERNENVTDEFETIQLAGFIAANARLIAGISLHLSYQYQFSGLYNSEGPHADLSAVSFGLTYQLLK